MVLPLLRKNEKLPSTDVRLKSPFLTEEELRLIGLSVSENFTDEDYKKLAIELEKEAKK